MLHIFQETRRLVQLECIYLEAMWEANGITQGVPLANSLANCYIKEICLLILTQ